MSVIKGCSFAVRVSTDPVIPIPTKKEKEEQLVDAEKNNNKKKPQQLRCVCFKHTAHFQRCPVHPALEQGEMYTF